MARDPAEGLRGELRKLLQDVAIYATRIAVLEERVRLLLWVVGVVAVGTIGAIIAAIATLVKGHP